MPLSPSDALRLAYGQLSRVEYAALATSSPSGEPWNSPVYTAYDDELNLYWTSAASSMHSQNIRSSGRAFLVIYNSTAPEGTGEGLYCAAVPESWTGSRRSPGGAGLWSAE
ncbi:MAG: pyridoxamine 5'-phosphate oxidase family protein [Mycobacteriales bacterium]